MLTQEVRGRQTVTEMELERIGPLYASLDSGQFGARRGRFRQGYAEAVTKLRRLLEQYKEHGRKQEVLNVGQDPLRLAQPAVPSFRVHEATAGLTRHALEGVDAQQGNMRKQVECALRGQRKPATLKQSPTSSWEEPHQERLKDINEQWWGCAFDFSVWRLDVR